MTAQQFDPSKYKDGQRQDWDSVADAWKKWWPYFEQNMQQVSTALCDMAGIKPGDRVLDISTGIGEPTVTVAGLVGPEGSVYATDQSPEMLRVARVRNLSVVDTGKRAIHQPSHGGRAESIAAPTAATSTGCTESIQAGSPGFDRIDI